METEIHINNLKNNGFSTLNNVLSDNDIDFFKKNIGSKHIDKMSRKEKVFLKRNDIFYKKLRYFFFNKKIFNIIKKYNLNEIASTALNSTAELSRVDGYYSEISDNFILDWHVDRAYSGDPSPQKFLSPDDYAIKCILYLDDVDTQNGCLGIIQKSNQITYYLRKGIFEKKIEYKPYWKLKDLVNYIKKENIKNYLMLFISEKIINEFLKNSEFILNEKDTFKFDLKHKKGDLLIFNETVVHRAAESKNTSRSIIRLFFK